MIRILVSILIFLTILIGNPSVATAVESPSPEAVEKTITDSLEMPSQLLPTNFLRLSEETLDNVDKLGPLKDLPGTWVGKGWNMIAVPINSDSSRNQVGCPGGIADPAKEDFCIEIAPYVETITFTPIGAEVPNRGFPENTFVVGLHYQQVVSDANTFEPQHIENGMWLLLDKDQGLVARLSSIPHGNTVLAIGNSFPISGNFQIPPTGGFPILENPSQAVGYENPYNSAQNVPPFTPSKPNQILQDIIDKQTLVTTEVLNVSTANQGGISNIPFIEQNADVTKFESVFWVELVKNENGKEFLQLQYSQTADLDFIHDFTSQDADKLIVWPHVDVATLVKQ